MKTAEKKLSISKKWKELNQFLVKTLAVFFLFAIPFISDAQGPVNVLGNPSVVNATIGDNFTITIQLDATGANVTVADIYMTFNPNVIHVTSTSFASGSPFTIPTFTAPQPDNVLGKWSRGGFGFTPATTLFDYITVNCTAVGSGTTTMDYVISPALGTLLAYAGENVTGTLYPIEINITTVTTDCPDLGVNNGDPCSVAGQSGEYVDCECLAYDCNGIPGGTASIDDCGACSGGDTGLTPNESCTDCEGVVNGSALPGSICFNGNNAGIYNANCECVSNALGSLNGHVVGLSDCGSRNITISIYNDEYPELNDVFTTTINANGDFTTPAFSTGIYSILIKIDGYLAKLYSDEIIGGGINPLMISGLVIGDINNSNSVNLGDVSSFNAAFGSIDGNANYNPLADLNCDGLINILDVSILNSNFGKVGDVAPTGN